MLLWYTTAFAGAKQDREQKDLVEGSGVSIDGNTRLGAHERAVVRAYYVEHYGKGHCPPGLAKKQNGCLPPGQAKKRYAVGHALDPSVVFAPLPPELETRMGPPPSGYVYGMVDGDVLKLSVGTSLVVDAVNAIVR
jgi:hypothetical protein